MPIYSPTPSISASNPNSIGPTKPGSDQAISSADHTHAFGPALQRSRVQVPSNGITTWTFDTPFVDQSGNAITPILACLVESPASTTLFQEPQITGLSNTSVTLTLRAQQQMVSLTGVTSIQLGNAAIPANTYLHLSARNPSA